MIKKVLELAANTIWLLSWLVPITLIATLLGFFLVMTWPYCVYISVVMAVFIWADKYRTIFK